MDQFDREQYASVYRALAEILDRDRSADHPDHQLAYALGDMTRRIFVGSPYLPPDELLAEVALVLRTAEPEHLHEMAQRLRDHAQHLDELNH